ncbi:MAG: SirB1 family protein [Microcoleaceae cyanobacterium]|jgi:regulator of sirC expression with transglutaminase-like and TPR domain
MSLLLARNYFEREINQPDVKIDLAKAALYIALEEEPDFEPEEYLNALDIMAWKVEEYLPETKYPLRVIQSINRYLYDDLEFQGNTWDYYDPRNSFLNEVIARRTGIPITLSLVYLEIAKRINFPMVGIGMPGHFLIRPEFEDVGIYVDPFHQGEVLFPEDCQARLTQIYHQSVPMQPAFFAPVTPRHFLARLLTNLKAIYLNQRQASRALTVVERILLLFPDAAIERRDRGLLCYQLGHPEGARQDLEIYLTHFPNAEDAVIIRQLLDQIDSEF